MTVNGVIHLQDPNLFIEELKKGGTICLQKLFDDAINTIQKQNEDILKRNAEKPWYIRFLNPLLNFFSCGCVTLLEKPLSLNPLQQNINTIQTAILSVPEMDQTWRPDYKKILERLEASKTIQRGFKTFIKKQEDAFRAREVYATKIQRKWRANLRNKLKKTGKTYEAWRADSILSRNSDPIQTAVKFREAYKASHYTFTHGQSLFNTVITTTINHLTERFKPEFAHPMNMHFRIPGTITCLSNTQDFIQKNPMQSNFDHQPHISSQLLCADAFIHSQLQGESAHYYYTTNSNAVVRNISADPILALVPDPIIVEKYIQKINSIAQEYTSKSVHGSLYTILVPKKFQANPDTQVAYASHAYGIPHQDQSTAFLDNHQNDNCNNFTQFRLVLSVLMRTPGVRIFRKNNLSLEENSTMLKKVKAETELLYAYSILLNLRSPISESQFNTVLKILITYNRSIDQESLKLILKKIRPYLKDEQFKHLHIFSFQAVKMNQEFLKSMIVASYNDKLKKLLEIDGLRITSVFLTDFHTLDYTTNGSQLVIEGDVSEETKRRLTDQTLIESNLLYAYAIIFNLNAPISLAQKNAASHFFNLHRNSIDPKVINELLNTKSALLTEDDKSWLKGYLNP